MRSLGHRRRGRLAGADRPDRLVGDHDTGGLRPRALRPGRGRAGPERRTSVAPASRSASRLPDAEDRVETDRQRRRHLLGQRLVRLAEELAPLGVAEEDAGRAGVGEHRHRNLARVRAALGLMAVLGQHAHPQRREHVRHLTEGRQRRADGEIDLVDLVQAPLQRLRERPGVGAELEHLPVARHDRRALDDPFGHVRMIPHPGRRRGAGRGPLCVRRREAPRRRAGCGLRGARGRRRHRWRRG